MWISLSREVVGRSYKPTTPEVSPVEITLFEQEMVVILLKQSLG